MMNFIYFVLQLLFLKLFKQLTYFDIQINFNTENEFNNDKLITSAKQDPFVGQRSY